MNELRSRCRFRIIYHSPKLINATRAMEPIMGPEIQALLGVELVGLRIIVVVGPGAIAELGVIELVKVESELEVNGGLEVGLVDEAKRRWLVIV
jgi:hypothetical protein